ncbi:hypothetical protein [Arcobacter defluvii]|uniref:Uncharacterized protein n=1 Tax=Arcobacter defluvii TaxID=873191 RepID=A0AAE7E733_9BACT|nr:hypothetical protein [Arcobacter defluvii]QKF77164.1 hypothetical protein ADFLV_1130 [Arcobacter defluvii]RXI33545.1 hypothetical protein CP964_06010 [Arcobacter defluvii]
MCKNEKIGKELKINSDLITSSAAIKLSLIDKKICDLSVLCSTFKSLCRSIEFSDYTDEKFSFGEIVNIMRKQNKLFNEALISIQDDIDLLGFDINKIEKDSKEDKKRLVRVAYAFINNGEIESAKKELEKIIAE